MGLNISFNEKKFSQIALIFLIFISSCGGGGSQLLSIEDGSIQATLTTTLFKPDAIMLADASAYYSSACNKPSFQFLIPTKINEDIYADFIAHFWCDTDTPAEYNEGPTPDALVAYVSDAFGEYKIDNINVFDQINAQLGGASRKYARGDINNDGKDDFAFAINWEDGRASFDYRSMVSNYAKPAVLLSNQSGYEIIKLGNKDWGHSVQIKDNKVFFAGHSSQVFEYTNQGWNDVSNNYPSLSFASFLLYDDYIINSIRSGTSQGLELVKNNEVISSIMIEESFKVNFESWNNTGTNNYSELGVYNIRGENYFHGMISEMCRKGDIIVASLNASKLKSGEIIEGGYYSESETTPVVMFSFYEIHNESLQELDINIINEEINHNFNFFDCMDVNNDQQKDIVAQVFSEQWNDLDNNRGIPEIYINNNGSYFNLDTSNWPSYSYSDDSQGYLHDVDDSSTQDLVVFPIKINTSGNIEIYITNKNITD